MPQPDTTPFKPIGLDSFITNPMLKALSGDKSTVDPIPLEMSPREKAEENLKRDWRQNYLRQHGTGNGQMDDYLMGANEHFAAAEREAHEKWVKSQEYQAAMAAIARKYPDTPETTNTGAKQDGGTPRHRGSLKAYTADEQAVIKHAQEDIVHGTATAAEITQTQTILKDHGADLGKFGKGHDGLDGVAGKFTNAAIKKTLSGP